MQRDSIILKEGYVLVKIIGESQIHNFFSLTDVIHNCCIADAEDKINVHFKNFFFHFEASKKSPGIIAIHFNLVLLNLYQSLN
jgi:hypothetical protein